MFLPRQWKFFQLNTKDCGVIVRSIHQGCQESLGIYHRMLLKGQYQLDSTINTDHSPSQEAVRRLQWNGRDFETARSSRYQSARPCTYENRLSGGTFSCRSSLHAVSTSRLFTPVRPCFITFMRCHEDGLAIGQSERKVSEARCQRTTKRSKCSRRQGFHSVFREVIDSISTFNVSLLFKTPCQIHTILL